MHYQVAPAGEPKFVRCVRGASWNVIVDMRPDSPTHRGWFGVDNLLWSNDYPHHRHDWPYSRRVIAESMAGVARALAGRFRTLRIDLLGHGASDAPRSLAPYSMPVHTSCRS